MDYYLQRVMRFKMTLIFVIELVLQQISVPEGQCHLQLSQLACKHALVSKF